MKNKMVVVTGGLGFIGSHLVEALCQKNEVIIVDNESTGKLENIKHLELDNISVDLGDITQIDLTNTFDGCDYVFHHAALASVPASVADPLLCNRVNITGILKVLLAARDTEVKKVIFASSSAVYGDNNDFPISEKAFLRPLSPYAVSKATGEMYCQNFTDIYGLPTASLRYFNVFGPRQDPNSQYAAVIPKFIEALRNVQQPIIYGDGEQTRDFIYVKDVVRANILGAESDVTGVFNIASGKSITINQLLKIIAKIMGKDLNPLHTETRPGDIKHSLADITKAKSFGFRLNTNFKEGIRETVNCFIDNNEK
jgi:UDP-N-acetylglucosamine/UDP-N-acetyl-alpha-D-glucosaminouronate 4-epimerase